MPLLLACFAALLLYAFLAAQSFLAKSRPEEPHAVGSPADTLEQAAADRIRRGLETLNDRSRPPAERLLAYRAELTAADGLLVRSLEADPARARALASLAAVRWELRSPLSAKEAAELLDMIEAASRMTDSPRTQMQLGEVLLKMGRSAEALTYIARAVERDGATSRQAVGILRDRNFRAAEILEALPPNAEVLTALRQPFLEDGDTLSYLEAVEKAIEGSPEGISSELLRAYGSACLRERAAGRLLETMTALHTSGRAALEAARLDQMSRAHLDLADPERAIAESEKAIALQPDAAYLRVQLGDAAKASGDQAAAVEAYRGALGILARESGSRLTRAALYRRIGQAEELRGEMGRAYDAYGMALDLDPQEPVAARRLREMREAAGLGPS